MEKKPNRFVPGAQEPGSEWDFVIDWKLNTVDAVPRKRRWAAEDEEITYAVASLAVSHRRYDIIARYLRQHHLDRIAGLFDRSNNGTEPDRVDFVKRSNSHRVLEERTKHQCLQTGGEIYYRHEGGMKLEEAIAIVKAKYGISRSTALDAYRFYKNNQTTSPNQS